MFALVGCTAIALTLPETGVEGPVATCPFGIGLGPIGVQAVDTRFTCAGSLEACNLAFCSSIIRIASNLNLGSSSLSFSMPRRIAIASARRFINSSLFNLYLAKSGISGSLLFWANAA